ncbi:MAG: SH3 domain-containing protein [Lachnospiraceae bacterium]|nr:SH3 domain-containing protein [Lachnospiraceae bacterium]
MRETRETERMKRERARRYESEDAREYRRRPSDGRRRKPRGRYEDNDRGGRRSGLSKSLPLILAGAVVAVIAIVLLGNGLFKEFGGSKERTDLFEYFGVTSESGTVLIINGEISDERAVIQNGSPFIPMSLANKLFDNFYYDSSEGHLLVTDAAKTTEGIAGTDYIAGEAVYISLAFINRFLPMSYEVYDDPSRIDLVTVAAQASDAEIAEDTALRVSADKQSAILMDLDNKETVRIIEENEDWAKVRYKAIEGYVEVKDIAEGRQAGTVQLSGGGEADLNYQKYLISDKVVLGFHNVAVPDANSYVREVIAQTKGMNVIAPTWFSLSDNEGNISDIGSGDYVYTARSLECGVWGVVDNFTNQVDTNEVLSHTSKRLLLEQNIINAAVNYDLQGINIDFEQLEGETGDDFAQFLRELSIQTRAHKLILSIDNYVPQDYTDFYRRDIQGKVAEYVVIMGYDEHTSASSEAGSVASLGFVTQGIEDTLKEVPASQVINAIPFYTRKWAYEGGTLSCESLGMRDAQAFIADNGIQTTWDAETAQNYASFEKDGVTYSIWLEDAESIASKLNVMTAHDLGGAACWKLGQEMPDIWDIIVSYYPNTVPIGAKDT